MQWSVLWFATLIFFSSFLNPGWTQEKAVALEVDLLIDGTGAEPVRDAVIVIEGKHVKSVGRKGAVSIPSGARILTVKGGTAFPGLIDSHVHYRDWQGELYLNHGVTTAFAIGSLPIEWIIAQRDGIAKGQIVGPRIFAAGPHLNGPEPGQRQRTIREVQAQHRGEITVANAEEAKKAVQELLASGADIIKVYEKTGPEAIKVAAEDARKAGKPIGGHSEDIFASVQSGYNFVEHSYAVVSSTIRDPKKKAELNRRRAAFRDRLSTPEYHYYAEQENFDELIRLMVDHKVSFGPTLATFWRFYSPDREGIKERDYQLLSHPGLAYVPPYFKANVRANHEGIAAITDTELLSRVKIGYEKIQDFIRRYVRAGGKIRVGSDPNSILPAWAVHVEMQLLTEAGLTPMEAILAATRNAAEMIHKEKEIGVIAPGSYADIVVVQGNPLQDITKTRNIKMVFKEGKEIKLGYNKNFTNPIPLGDADRPTPEIDKISPSHVVQGEGPVALTIEGGNFMSTSIALLNGKPLPTKIELSPRPYPQNFDRARKLTATVDPKLIKKAGTYSVTVVEPGQGGSVSNPAYLTVKFR
jgi:imidazolonepropionase-like amidohydrolase